MIGSLPAGDFDRDDPISSVLESPAPPSDELYGDSFVGNRVDVGAAAIRVAVTGNPLPDLVQDSMRARCPREHPYLSVPRVVDCPAILAAASGTETHAVWLATPEQRAILDQAEGRGERYRLAWVRVPITLANGTRLEWMLAYLAWPEVIGQDVEQHLNGSPLLSDERTVGVFDVGQAEARGMTGELANSDGLESIAVDGEPSLADLQQTGH